MDDCDQRMTCRDCLSDDNRCFWARNNLSIDSFCLQDLLRVVNKSVWLRPGNYVDCFFSESTLADHKREASAEELRSGYIILGLVALLLVFIVLCIVTRMKSEQQGTTARPTPGINSLPVICEACNEYFIEGRIKSWVKNAQPQPDDALTSIEVPEELVIRGSAALPPKTI